MLRSEADALSSLQMRRRARSSSILGSHKSDSVQLLGADQIDDGALERECARLLALRRS